MARKFSPSFKLFADTRPDFTDPRKVESGTTLESKGSVPLPADAMKEKGSGIPVKIPDVVPRFSSRSQQLRIYEEMRASDVTVDVSLRATKVPIQGASFFMQPFDDNQINQDISEFVDFNIFHGTSRPFILVLEDILRMFDDGFSILEPTWETREWSPSRSGANRKKYTMLQKLAPRPASTITEFKYDDQGGPVSVTQQAIREDGNAEEVELKIEKILIFTFGGVGGDLQGRSILRTAYEPWFYKNTLYKIDAIQKERNALGIPVMELPDGYTAGDVSAAWEMVTNMRTNEKTGVVEPPGFKFRFEKQEGQPVDIMPSIEHHDARILLNVMAQFLLLGLQGGGGRATSGSHVDMFQKAMKYIANYICGVFNLYLIPKLVGYNFDTTQFPQMRVRNIGETKDIQMWASAHSNLLSQGALTKTLESENWYRENLDMPYITEAERDAGIEEASGATTDPSGGNSNGTPDPNKNGKGSVEANNRHTGTGNTQTTPGAESVS